MPRTAADPAVSNQAILSDMAGPHEKAGTEGLMPTRISRIRAEPVHTATQSSDCKPEGFEVMLFVWDPTLRSYAGVPCVEGGSGTPIDGSPRFVGCVRVAT